MQALKHIRCLPQTASRRVIGTRGLCCHAHLLTILRRARQSLLLQHACLQFWMYSSYILSRPLSRMLLISLARPAAGRDDACPLCRMMILLMPLVQGQDRWTASHPDCRVFMALLQCCPAASLQTLTPSLLPILTSCLDESRSAYSSRHIQNSASSAPWQAIPCMQGRSCSVTFNAYMSSGQVSFGIRRLSS